MKQAKPDLETGFITVAGTRIAFSIIRSRKRKRTIAFKMNQDASLHVMAPASASLGSVTKIMQTNAPWVARKLEQRKKCLPTCSFLDGSPISYLGHICVLRVTRGGMAPSSCRLLRRVIHVHVPDENLSPQGLRDEVKLELALWLKKRARILFKKRLDLWMTRLDVHYAKLIVTDPERRWGSCSVDNIIRLNWRLMLAPLPMLDYVAAHELCHVRHKNHSARFWGFLENKMPDWRERRKILRGLEQSLTL